MSVNARSESRLRKEKNAKTSTAQKLSPDKPHLTHLTIKSQNPHRRDQTDKFHKSPDAGKKSPGGYSDAEFNSTKKSPAKDDVKVQVRNFEYFVEV